jgi:hypothetical protein
MQFEDVLNLFREFSLASGHQFSTSHTSHNPRSTLELENKKFKLENLDQNYIQKSIETSTQKSTHTSLIHTNKINDCEFCDAKASLNLEEGIYVCSKCHTVNKRHIDPSAEWRYYGHEDSKSSDPARCGPPVNEMMPFMGSILAASGCTRFSPGSQMIRKYQMWNAMTYRERALYNVCDLIAVSASKNEIPQVIVEEAKVMYKRISESRISRGENRIAIIATCIYMACY